MFAVKQKTASNFCKVNTVKNKTSVTLIFCLCVLATAWSQSTTTRTPAKTTTTQRTSAGTAATTATTGTVMPAGTTFEVRVNEPLSSETAVSGDKFSGTLAEDMMVNGKIIFPRGSEVSGRVLTAKPSGRLSDSGELELSVNTISSGARAVAVSVKSFAVKGQTHTKSNTTKIGGGAALGAIIGAVAGGGKGAAIGATVGAAAGTGAAAATGKQEAKVATEAVLRFETRNTATVGSATRILQQDRNTELKRRGEETSSGTYSSPSTSTSGSTNTDQTTTSNSQNTASTSTATTTSPIYGSTSGSTTSSDEPPVLSRRTTQDNTGQTSTNTNTTNQGTSTSTSTSTNTTVVTSFSARDRRVINGCLMDNAASLPAGLTRRVTQSVFMNDQMVKNGTLPQANLKQLRALPWVCERQLPPTSNDAERVIFNRKVMIIDGSNRILDIFEISADVEER